MTGHFEMPLLLELATLIVSVTWVVAQIKSTTRELNMTITQLKEAVGDLKTTILKIDDRVTDHAERLTRLEEKFGSWRAQ